MKEISYTPEKQEQIKTTYMLIESQRIIPLGNFRDRNLTKGNFKLYGIIKEKLYEISVNDFEISKHEILKEELFEIKSVNGCILFIQKRCIPHEVIKLIEQDIKERER